MKYSVNGCDGSQLEIEADSCDSAARLFMQQRNVTFLQRIAVFDTNDDGCTYSVCKLADGEFKFYIRFEFVSTGNGMHKPRGWV